MVAQPVLKINHCYIHRREVVLDWTILRNINSRNKKGHRDKVPFEFNSGLAELMAKSAYPWFLFLVGMLSVLPVRPLMPASGLPVLIVLP